MREYLRGKFILCGATLASVHVLVWFGKVGEGVYGAVVAGTIGAFIAAEAFERAKP